MLDWQKVHEAINKRENSCGISGLRQLPEPPISSRHILTATIAYILVILGIVGLSYLVF